MNKPFDIDEWLRIASSEAPSTQEKKKRKDNNLSVKKYIEDLNITPGNMSIPNYVFYYHYLTTWEEKYKDQGFHKANKIVFFRILNQTLNSKTRTGKQRFYLISPESFQITEELLQKAEAHEKIQES